MACRGVFFAIDKKTAKRLRKISRSLIVDYVQEKIEEVYFDKHVNRVAETDKAWDAIQRAFSESLLEFAPTTGAYPANAIILGGEILYGNREGEDDYIISLKAPDMVSDICGFLSTLNEERFRTLYFKIDAEKYDFSVDEQDFEYTWEWLDGTRDFWKNAAKNELYVIFTVDL
ncbi:MAG: YfbM family protein [Clostridiales bacterium]|nr:YfbM family protein [Clostridiales bacterium]